MSESKQESSDVYRVVDGRGGRHSIAADRMMIDGNTVMFFNTANERIGIFVSPVGVMLDEVSQSFPFSESVEGCVSVFGAAELGAVPVDWVKVVGVAGLIGLFGLKVYELLWFAGVS